jgi:ABC-2 type transport system permease protein
MNAVAGEKEKGTAAMVLSKPIPRWIFILSKYIAQGSVYLLAISSAGLAAYYYTSYLFDGLHFSGFAMANFLIYLWLMVLAAVSLLGSSIGKTTAAAAGIALLGGIILLLSGAIPRYGALFTSGLINWATASSMNIEGVANGGALATALGLILLMLVGAIASIEEQEI